MGFLKPNGVDVQEEFAVLMARLADAYPTARLTEGLVRTYAAALSDLTAEQVRRAMMRAVQELKFMPSVAELRSYVVPLPDEAAALAWTALQRAASAVGAYASIELEDRCAAEALVQVWGSWPAYCEAEGAAVGARKAEFLAAYRAARRQGELAQAVRLPGLCESGHQYRPMPGLWCGRITARGQVEAVPEQQALPPAGERKALGE